MKVRSFLKGLSDTFSSKLPRPRILFEAPRVLYTVIKIGSGWLFIKSASFFDIVSVDRIEETNTACFLRMQGYYLIMSGARDLIHQGLTSVAARYEPTREPAITEKTIAKTHNAHKKKSLQKKLDKQDRKTQSEEHSILCLEDKVGYFLEVPKAVCDLMVSSIACSSLIKVMGDQMAMGVNVLGLSWPKGIEVSRVSPFMEFMNVPLTSTLYIGLLGVNSLYNLAKLIAIINQRYHSPRAALLHRFVFGFANSNAYLRFSASIFKAYKQDPTKDIVIPKGTPYDLIPAIIEAEQEKFLREGMIELEKYAFKKDVLRAINYYAGFEIYYYAARIAYNALDYWWNQFESELEALELPSSPSEIINQERRHPTPRLHFSYPSNPVYEGSIVFSPSPSPSSSSVDSDVSKTSATAENSEQPAKKTKVKTRGTPTANSANVENQTPLAPVLDASVWILHRPYDHKVRQENLDTINTLRLQNQASIQEINSLFNALLRHLSFQDKNLNPNGASFTAAIIRAAYIEKLGGSERRLTWHYRDLQGQIKTKSLKFEEHGKYQGSYLRKVLNVIEAAFLWGWDKKHYLDYLTTRPKPSKLEQLMEVISEKRARP